jgi:Predicted 3'-5' exonuclease related to the exonuclease domain of PolB/Domain of unknown function (DUF4160)
MPMRRRRMRCPLMALSRQSATGKRRPFSGSKMTSAPFASIRRDCALSARYPRNLTRFARAFGGSGNASSAAIRMFNGTGFDLPVLRYRAMVNKVSATGLSARPYFNRYTEDALDLCDVLASFNPQCRASLDEICRLMGMPGKPDGLSGSDVETYFRDGRIGEIAAYCEENVVNTYRLWLRHELFRGRLDQSKFAESELRLEAFIDARKNSIAFAQRQAMRMAKVEILVEDRLWEELSEGFYWEERRSEPQRNLKWDDGIAEFIVARVSGLSIKIWADEHPPPHFHVSYQAQDASFSILNCSRLPGTTGLERYERVIRNWWRENQAVLIDKWNASRPSDCPVGKVVVE